LKVGKHVKYRKQWKSKSLKFGSSVYKVGKHVKYRKQWESKALKI